MTITKKADGKRLIISVNGRIDTITAPRLERETLADIGATDEFIIDFSELDYISSAGLRSLLNIKKAIGKERKLTVTGCRDEILEIFEITGFYYVFNIK